MVKQIQSSINGDDDSLRGDALAGKRVGDGLCRFLSKDWGGNCRDHCSGSGSCDVLRRMGFQNVSGR